VSRSRIAKWSQGGARSNELVDVLISDALAYLRFGAPAARILCEDDASATYEDEHRSRRGSCTSTA
jgi:hypothetical protein